MENNKLNLKILTSIFIVFFFIVFFNSSSYAMTYETSLQPIIDYVDNDSSIQEDLSNYNYCFFWLTNNDYFYNNAYQVVLTNDSPFNISWVYDGSRTTISTSNSCSYYTVTYYRNGSFNKYGPRRRFWYFNIWRVCFQF